MGDHFGIIWVLNLCQGLTLSSISLVYNLHSLRCLRSRCSSGAGAGRASLAPPTARGRENAASGTGTCAATGKHTNADGGNVEKNKMYDRNIM